MMSIVRINPDALKAIREKDGHTQLSLAAASGVSQNRISELESAEKSSVRPTTVKALADVLQVPVSALVLADEPEVVA